MIEVEYKLSVEFSIATKFHYYQTVSGEYIRNIGPKQRKKRKLKFDYVSGDRFSAIIFDFFSFVFIGSYANHGHACAYSYR